MTDLELREIEEAAVELARNAGKILLDYFAGPLNIAYKSENNRNPVTDADTAADEYLRGEIAKRFPEHGVLTEESTEGDDRRASVIWVIDPLDGTTNFLNGLPLFGVLIGVLEAGVPVACAIFMPSITRLGGHVLHARAGGGAFDEEVRLNLTETAETARRMASYPSYFLRMFSWRRGIRRRLGDVRVTGSTGFELAHAALGVFDYAVFSNQWLWDVASGVLLIQEAGGSVLSYDRRTKRWSPFDRFAVKQAEEIATVREQRSWRGSLVVGTASATAFITPGLKIRTFMWRRLRQRIIDRLRRHGAVPAAAAAPQSQGQGRSRRE